MMHAASRRNIAKVIGVFNDYVNATKTTTFKPNMRYHNAPTQKKKFVNMVTVVVQQFKNTEPMNHCQIKIKIILCDVHNNT
jgi:hypothetical protein